MKKSYCIDLTGATKRAEIHERIQQTLPVPEWYGRNLDALYDVLTEPGLGDGECRICFRGCAAAKNSIPRYLAAMQQMCLAACERSKGLSVEFVD